MNTYYKARKTVDASRIAKGKRVVFRLFNRTNLGDVVEVKHHTVVTMAMRNGMVITLPIESVEKIIGEPS